MEKLQALLVTARKKVTGSKCYDMYYNYWYIFDKNAKHQTIMYVAYIFFFILRIRIIVKTWIKIRIHILAV